MISSSSRLQDELKVIATVLIVVVIWEITARILSGNLDSDRQHIHQFPKLSKEIQVSQHPTVLFLGNSLTLRGVNISIVCEELKKTKVSERCFKIVPTSTAIIDWFYLYKRYFEEVQQHPDVVVIGFVAHHVPDVESIKIPRLGKHFLSARCLPELLSEDLKDFDDRFKAVICFISYGFGDQPEHKYYLLNAFIPDFRYGTRRATHSIEANLEKKASPTKTYHRLERMAILLRHNNVHGIFIAMPKPYVWDLDPKIAETVCAAGMTFIDARNIDTMTEDDYADGYHLGEKGAEKYSRFVAAKIAEILPRLENSKRCNAP